MLLIILSGERTEEELTAPLFFPLLSLALTLDLNLTLARSFLQVNR
jgi:hypothetical protein